MWEIKRKVKEEMVEAARHHQHGISGGGGEMSNLNNHMAVVGSVIEVHPTMVSPSAVEIVSVNMDSS